MIVESSTLDFPKIDVGYWELGRFPGIAYLGIMFHNAEPVRPSQVAELVL